MKILNVGSNYRVQGGSDRYFLALEALLEAKGHEVVPFAARHPDNRESEWASHFPEGVDPDAPAAGDVARFVFNRPARRQMARLLEASRPDLVHLHVYSGQLSGSILEPLGESGVPVVQTLHDFKLACPVRTFVSRDRVCEACEGSHFWRALPRRCNRGSLPRTAVNVLEAYVSRWLGDVEAIDQFIVVSDFLREKMLEHDVVPPDRITTLHNFLDPSSVRPASGMGDHFTYAGRLTPLKGVEVLLEAAADLPGRRLVIAGEGRSREDLEATAISRNMHHVSFVGFQHDRELHRLIRGGICTVVPSVGYESFGLSALESFALGRPVVASRIGALPEVVEEGEDGFLVPPGDADALRERLRWMSEHPEEARQMGVSGRRKVEERFGPEPHYEGLMRVYRRVLDGTAVVS